MSDSRGRKMAAVLRGHQDEIVDEWVRQQLGGGGVPAREGDVREESTRILSALEGLLSTAARDDVNASEYQPVRELLAEISRSRTRLGFTPTDTANSLFALKAPLFARLWREHGTDTDGLMADTLAASQLIDRLALFMTEVAFKGREEIIGRQQQQLLELSTPVVRLWDGILALPLIGTLDSSRTQTAMESLLQQIIDTRSPIAILDITGVPMVDTMVAQHLLKTVAAARLIGADCIISGVRPQIAQTIVHLGIDLRDVITKATLADAFAVALQRTGRTIRRIEP
jgi:rsbT co-antagonist protein RsbR